MADTTVIRGLVYRACPACGSEGFLYEDAYSHHPLTGVALGAAAPTKTVECWTCRGDGWFPVGSPDIAKRSGKMRAWVLWTADRLDDDGWDYTFKRAKGHKFTGDPVDRFSVEAACALLAHVRELAALVPHQGEDPCRGADGAMVWSIGPRRITRWLAERAYAAYSEKQGEDQSLDRMLQRGGFGNEELDELVPGWRDGPDTPKGRAVLRVLQEERDA